MNKFIINVLENKIKLKTLGRKLVLVSAHDITLAHFLRNFIFDNYKEVLK